MSLKVLIRIQAYNLSTQKTGRKVNVSLSDIYSKSETYLGAGQDSGETEIFKSKIVSMLAILLTVF